MSFPASIPAAVVETIIAFLLPWLLPATAGDVATARASAIALLAEAQAQTARELRLAAEVIVHSFKAMALTSPTAVPGLPADAADPPLKAAASLARHSHLAQRRLDELQRRAEHGQAAANTEPGGAPAHQRLAGARTEPRPPVAPTAEADATPPTAQATQAAPATPSANQPAAPDLAQAEAIYATALQQLTVMKAQWKGAPQPHTKAGQDIQRQQRLVDAARMALAQARRRHAMA